MQNQLLIFLVLFPILLSAQINTSENYKTYISNAVKEYRLKNYKRSLEIYEEAFLTEESRMVDLYNAACCASLINDFEKANNYLLKSIESGYIDKNHLLSDKDFINFKQDQRWEKCVQEIDTSIQKLENRFDILRQYSLKDLIPFIENNLWGYLNRNSKKIVIEAQYKNVSFGGDCLDIQLNDYARIVVTQDGNISLIESMFAFRHLPYWKPKCQYYSMRTDKDSLNRGFIMKENSRNVKVSSIFDQYDEIMMENECFVQITKCSQPFKYKGQWRLFVSYRDKWILIKQNGDKDEEWDQEYKLIESINEFEGDENWFYFIDSQDNTGFINSKKEIIFYNEIESGLYSSLYQPLNLRLVTKGDKNGVFNLKTMSWLLKPIKKKIERIKFTYEGSCFDDYFYNSDKVKILDYFFLVTDRNNKTYYIDSDGKEYLPK